MNITRGERKWLDAFIGAINREFPGKVQRVLLFGSKARGDAGPDSDLDVLVVIHGEDPLKSQIRRRGYELAIGGDVVPSIAVYTVSEFEERKRHRSVFLETIEREGAVVL